MIIGVYHPLEVGQIHEGDYQRNKGEFYTIKLRVLRVATYQEWLDYRHSEGLDIIPHNDGDTAYFYEAITD